MMRAQTLQIGLTHLGMFSGTPLGAMPAQNHER
jgi:hypothetical protein